MAVDVEDEFGKGRSVDDSQPVSLSRLERECGVHVEADDGAGVRVRSRLGPKVCAVVCEINQGGVYQSRVSERNSNQEITIKLTRNGLDASRVGWSDVLFNEHSL